MKFFILPFILFPYLVFAQNADNKLIPADEIGVRDPYIYADPQTQNYYMYVQMDNRLNRSNEEKKNKGVEVYVSKDLKQWESPRTALLLPDNFWGRKAVWAPEMHAYRGKFYLFVTLTSSDTLTGETVPKGEKNWPSFYKRGTQIFVSDSPLGPFKPFDNKPHTPSSWMALDGTLYVEDGRPYMVFCHEWVQVQDGTMEYVPLKEDLSAPVGRPTLMFRASEASWVANKTGKVTDGCFLYKTKKGKLLMIWSSFGTSGYAVGIAESKSGKLKGPWIQQDKLLFKENGGHGMIFRAFDGKLLLALHQPNNPGGKERLKLFEIEDTGDALQLK